MENEVFQQLMIADENAMMSSEQKEFVVTHRQIMQCGAMAGQYVVEMARKLKVMRDGKLYKAAGFDEFRDYVKDAVGIEERQAYTYIKVAEGLSEEFLSANAALGITKLALLASAEKEDREKAVEEGIAQDGTTRELQEYIKKLEAERDNKAEQLSFFSKEKDAAVAEKESARAEADKAQKKLTAAEKKVLKLNEEKAKLEKELEDLRNAPAQVEQVDNPETVAKLKEAETARDAALAASESLRKQLDIASDDKMARFKILFEDFQLMLGKMFSVLKEMDSEKKNKCIAAMQTIIKERGL